MAWQTSETGALRRALLVPSSVIQAITVNAERPTYYRCRNLSFICPSACFCVASKMKFIRKFSDHKLVIAIAVLSICIGYRGRCEAAFSEYEDIVFELYTRDQVDSHQRLNTSWGDNIFQTNWRSSRPTRMFVHGFKSKRKTLDKYKNAFLASGDYNVIVVNWLKGSSTYNYYVAKNRVKKVSAFRRIIDRIWFSQRCAS